jgi:RNA polymerase sigma-70 factor (ECF subfamily)
MKTDAQLIAAARRDPGAFAELYERHARAIDSFLRARAPGQEASELTAETFARAALSLRRFRDEAGGSALPWLYGIARNLLRDYYERARVETRARERLGMPIQHYDLGIDEAGERIDAQRVAPALRAALGTLPAAQRRAVELRVLDELPYAEVGRSLGCSPLAARIKVSRALGALSRIMEGAVT